MSQYRFTKDFGVMKAGSIITIGEMVTVSFFDLVKEGILEEVKEEAWPKVGEDYWFVNMYGQAVYDEWFNGEFETAVKDFLGIYRTKEEAEKARDDVREFIKNGDKSND